MIELILMQRVEKLGQMGERVKVRPGFARNFLLPQGKAIRATKENLERFQQQRAHLEAQNLKRREEAERIAERVAGLTVVLIRQAGESGALYGSVSARDIAEACRGAGLGTARPAPPAPGASAAPEGAGQRPRPGSAFGNPAGGIAGRDRRLV